MKDMNRRDFIINIGRWLLLGLLAGGTAALVARSGETCVNRGICRGCSEFSSCGLPQALSAKQAGVSEATWRTNTKK